MKQPIRIQQIPLDRGDGRHLRYALKPNDLTANDRFIILADDQFAHNTFADHPHAGIQTVTLVLEGSLQHYDSKSEGGGRLHEGDFQMMTAGRGIIHNENPDAGEEVRVLQLWVNLSPEHKKVDSFYEDIPKAEAKTFAFEGGKGTVYAGRLHGVESQLKLYTPYTYVLVEMEAGSEFTFEVEADYNAYVYTLDGAFEIGGEMIGDHTMLHFGQEEEVSSITVKANEAGRFVYFAGLPIKAPVVAQGPFVMNTQEEIYELFAKYRDGSFLDGKSY